MRAPQIALRVHTLTWKIIMSQDCFIRHAEIADRKAWDEYVYGRKDGVAYHDFAWKQAIEDAYGFECPYFIAEKANQIRGVMPTVHIHLPFKKGSLVSLPYCDLGGVLADNPIIAEKLFDHACQFAREFKIPQIEIRQTIDLLSLSTFAYSNANIKNLRRFNAKTAYTEKVRMILDLPGSSERLLAGFKSKLRSQIRKPFKDGLTTKIGGPELLESFYKIFAENMRALGSPVHSKKWFYSILKYYGNKAKCGIALMADRTPAAGGIIICHRNIVSIPWASSIPRFNRFNPNMLLYWRFLQFAADNGYGFFDFGRSTRGEGTYRFKAQWGAKPQDLYWQRWKVRGDSVKKHDKVTSGRSNKRKLIEHTIRKMPLALTTAIGSRLRKYVSL